MRSQLTSSTFSSALTSAILLGFLALLSAGCQNSPCREIQHQKQEQAKQAQAAAGGGAKSFSSDDEVVVAPSMGAGQLKVRVYKPDGSLQCNMGKKISLEAMEKDLKGIAVYNRSNRNDGLMRIQVCGAPTGNSNVYEISRNDLEKALKLGFREWTFD